MHKCTTCMNQDKNFRECNLYLDEKEDCDRYVPDRARNDVTDVDTIAFYLRNFYEALLAEGFSDEQAIYIISNY